MLRHRWLLLILICQAHLAIAQSSPLPATVTAILDQAGIPESHVGIYAQEIGTSEPLISVNATQPMRPASIMKLVTTYAGLRMLGPAYTWNTEIYANKRPKANGVLNSDLFIKGYGDPKLNLENFWLMLNDLRQRGVRDIRGNLVLDHTLFSEIGNPSQFDGKPDRPYNILPDALIAGFKSVSLQFIPAADHHHVIITSIPLLATVKIDNDLVIDDAPCGDWANRMTVDISDNGKFAHLHFSGNYSATCGEKERSYSVLGDSQYIHTLFTTLWKQLGGKFSGNVHDGTTPVDAKLLLSHTSPPLSEIVRDTNKFSNNLMARQIFLTLGTTNGGTGSPESAAAAIKQWLSQNGLDFPELVLENGCGLSRTERISAQSMGRLLLDAYASTVMPELMSSLPIIAVDGTMHKRLNDTAVAAHGHIKTGLLDDVRSMAGYVLDAKGRRVVVVFIVNDTQLDAAQNAQDALLQWLYARP